MLCLDAHRRRVVGCFPPLREPGRICNATDACNMTSDQPHYLLFSEASRQECATAQWRFVLQDVATKRRFSACDSEPCADGVERLELLAVVRGLEAIDRPSRVTLVTKSRYVSRGLNRGVREWRENDWRWERFGRIVPVRDHDLWRRVNRAVEIHEVDCQAWQFEVEEQAPAAEIYSREKNSNRHHSRLRPRVPVRRVKRRRPPTGRPVGNWVDRWSDAIGALTRPAGVPLGSGATG